MGSPGFEPGSTAPKAASIAKLTHDPVLHNIRWDRENVSFSAPRDLSTVNKCTAMVTTLEIGLLVVALAVLFGAYRIIKAVKPFIVNAVVGVIVLVIASFLGLGVEITPIAVLICAIGGVPGALLVLLLGYTGVAFAGMAVPFGVLAVG